MAERVDYVVQADETGRWTIVMGRHLYGPYVSREAAERRAIETAFKSLRAGYDAKVLLRTAEGETEIPVQ